MTTTAATDRIRDLIAESIDELVAIRHDLHAHPELGFEERRTSEIVQQRLKSAKIDFVAGLAGGTGVLAHLPGRAGGAVGLRADMDALPITEETGLPYASTKPGVMHACGHDGHTTILIGAAQILAALAREGQLPRPVTFCFQPAEEGLGGGQRMVEDGVLDGSRIGPPVENMFGLHGWPQLEVGKVGTRPGPFLAAADNFDIVVRGSGGHAAFPHLNRNPVVCAGALVSALQTIPSRNVDPLESVVLSITSIHGGTAYNVMPESINLSGTVRSLNPDVQELTKSRMQEIAERIADAFGCTAEFAYRLGYPITLNDAEMVAVFEETAVGAIGQDRVERLARPVMGAEDFAYYCREIPSCFFALGLMPEGPAPMPPLHHPKFDFNDGAIALGVEMFCRLALRDA